MPKMDDLVKAGQKVAIRRTVTFAYVMDFSEYLDGEDISEMSVEDLQRDIMDLTSVSDELHEHGILSDVVEIRQIF